MRIFNSSIKFPIYGAVQFSNLFVGNDPVSFRYGANIRWHKFQKEYPTNFLCYRLLPDFPSITKEALIKSPRAIGERFCSKLRFGKRRNTLCISSFSNRKVGTKDSLSADGYLFRVSLDRV